MEDKEFYSTDDVVFISGLSKPTVLKAIKIGTLKPSNVGKGRRSHKFSKEEVERFVKSLSKSIDISKEDVSISIQKNKLLQQKKIAEILIARNRKNRVKAYELLSELIDLKLLAVDLKKKLLK